MQAGAFFAIALASMGMSSAASAASVLYTLSCTDVAERCENFFGDGTLTFVLPQFPVPDKIISRSFFQLNSVTGTVNDDPATFTNMLFFLDGAWEFDLPAMTKGFIFVGAHLFQGSLGSPEIVAGDFPISSALIAGNGGKRTNFELNAVLVPGPITDPSPVPVPLSLIMMLSGLAMLGAARQAAPGRH